MKIGELRGLLQKLGSIQEAMGARAPAKDLSAIDELFVGREEQSVEEFVEAAEQELEARPPSRQKKAAVPNARIVADFVDRLKAENSADGAFDTVYSELVNSKSIGKAEAIAIARGFVGVELSFKTKQAAFDKIHSIYVRDRQSEAKRGIIDRMAI